MKRPRIKFSTQRDRNGVTLFAETLHNGDLITCTERVGATEIAHSNLSAAALFRLAFRQAKHETLRVVGSVTHSEHLWELAREYYRLTEAFDVRNCSGRNHREPHCAMPINAHERGRSNGYAQSVMQHMRERCGDPDEFRRVRMQYLDSAQHREDMAEVHRKWGRE